MQQLGAILDAVGKEMRANLVAFEFGVLVIAVSKAEAQALDAVERRERTRGVRLNFTLSGAF